MINVIKKKGNIFSIIFIALITSWIFAFLSFSENEKIISYEVDLKQKNLKLYWKDDNNEILGNLLNLKKFLKEKKENLLFATNGGMYKKDSSPQGLFIQENKTLISIDTSKGNGNFYLKPNGVFYITDEKKASICITQNYKVGSKIKYATQSGPMLVINGEIH